MILGALMSRADRPTPRSNSVRLSIKRAVVLLAASMAIGCGGETTREPADGSAATPGGGSGGAGGATDGSSESGNACPATCSTPPGRQPFPFQSLELAYALLAGRWKICANARDLFADAPADTAGIELVAPAAG